MNKNSRGLKPILIIVILGFIFLTGYFVLKPTRTPSPTPTAPTESSTANWKTYRNEFLLFKYPPEWVVGKKNIYTSGNETEFVFNYGKPLYLNIRTNYNQTTGEPYSTLDEYLPSLSDISKNITLDNQPARYISREGGEHVIASEEVVVFSVDKSMIIELTYQPDFYNPENREVFNHVLSTFSFLDGEQSAEGARCGGEANLQCPQGHICLKQPNIPKAEGWCINTVCPDTQFVICIPENIDPETAPYCNPEYATWIQNSCPGVAVVY